MESKPLIYGKTDRVVTKAVFDRRIQDSGFRIVVSASRIDKLSFFVCVSGD